MLFFKKVAQHKDTVTSLTENTEETNEARDECTEEIFLSEIFVHKLRVMNFRALQHAKEKIGNRMKQRQECSKFLKETDT
jgi:hypothetical protein